MYYNLTVIMIVIVILETDLKRDVKGKGIFRMVLRSLGYKRKSSGATVIEYALIVSLLSIILIGGYKKIGQSYGGLYTKISDKMDNGE